MLHSELTKRLYDLLNTSPLTLKQRIDKLVYDTRLGVNRECGSLTAILVEPAADAGRDSKAAAPVKAVAEPGHDTGFNWGPKSFAELKGVHPQLVSCATLALKRFSKVDFMCFDGTRTTAEQKHYVAIGTSQTMQSKHLIQKDCYGHAVDLVPVIGGVPKWDWQAIYEVAWAMDQAATQLGIANHIRWGGAWDRTLADFGGDVGKYYDESQAYIKRHPGKDFLDGPHFEWKD
jgi:peptidoglycan L-alanyl-D-glutamate endopeptidase CwlK